MVLVYVKRDLPEAKYFNYIQKARSPIRATGSRPGRRCGRFRWPRRRPTAGAWNFTATQQRIELIVSRGGARRGTSWVVACQAPTVRVADEVWRHRKLLHPRDLRLGHTLIPLGPSGSRATAFMPEALCSRLFSPQALSRALVHFR